ncbi:MAG: lipoprotein signal peptidase [Gammaproteobacteria bacterium]|nr:lipoprotein signal peptidase [Gammaproteobacteria bacterium]
MRTSSLKWIWLSVLVAALDQITKYLATRYLELHEPLAIMNGVNLTLVHNTGAAFSILRDAAGWQRILFIGLSSVISVGIIVWLSRFSGRALLACALALILGGALGNLWDRVSLGYVIDFIDLYYNRWHWPAFNVADSSISVGAILLIIDAFFFDRAEVSMSGKRQ